MTYLSAVRLKGTDSDRLRRLQTVYPTSTFNYRPTYGLSAIRYDDLSVNGGGVIETGGEFKVSTGTNGDGVGSAQTIKKAQYQAGTIGVVGIGARVPTAPTGNQDLKWGYYNTQNGFGFGYDATGVYAFYRKDGTDTKIRQADWNVDKLDGTGASGLTLDISNGYIFEIDFLWYGYGDIDFNVVIYNDNSNVLADQKIRVHSLNIPDVVSITDPNQPVTFEADNNGTTSNIDMYIGGHQFSFYSGSHFEQKRSVAEIISNYATALNTDWQPLIAIRPKATFRSRPNSINIELQHFELSSDDELEVRMTIGAVTSNLEWGTPTGWSANETGSETKVSSAGDRLTASTDGNPFEYAFSDGTKQSVGSTMQTVDFTLGDAQEAVLWCRRLSASGAINVRSAHIRWVENW